MLSDVVDDHSCHGCTQLEHIDSNMQEYVVLHKPCATNFLLHHRALKILVLFYLSDVIFKFFFSDLFVDLQEHKKLSSNNYKCY